MPAGGQNPHPRNRLARGGTSQTERYLRALDPDSIGLDERTTADLILFAGRFSRELVYYNAANQPAGDWQPFFEGDISAILAGLSSLPLEVFRRFSAALQDHLSAEPDRVEAELKAHFKLAFFLPLLLLAEASRFYLRRSAEHPLNAALPALVSREILPDLAALLSYFKGALDLGNLPNGQPLFSDTPLALADYNTTSDAPGLLRLPPTLVERIDETQPLSGLALADAFFPSGWAAFYAAQAADTAPYADSVDLNPGAVYRQIYDALHYNLLGEAFGRLFQGLERLAEVAGRYLDESLVSFDRHTPHYGLWLAFLRLYRHNQTQLNGLTARHLDFYFRQVLGFSPRPPEPDRAFLLFELNKNVPDHLLPAGSAFKAGKDGTGGELLFASEADFVINRARVAELKAVQRFAAPGGTFRMLASPQAASTDGQGAPLPEERPAWKPFGPPEAGPARLGFAVADKALFLREGSRMIRLTVEATQEIPQAALRKYFRCSYTAPEGWQELGADSTSEIYVIGKDLVFELRFHGELPPVVPLDLKIHGEALAPGLPALCVELVAPAGEAAGLPHWLTSVQFSDLELEVAASDLRNVWLGNESGALDPTKPFLPFGAAPGQGSSFILGSSELFSKELSALNLHLTWEKTPDQYSYFYKYASSGYQMRLRRLSQGAWSGEYAGFDYPLFQAAESAGGESGSAQASLSAERRAAGEKTQKSQEFASSIDASAKEESIAAGEMAYAVQMTLYDPGAPFRGIVSLPQIAAGPAVPQAADNPPYTPASQTGFIRLELNQDFGHRFYPDEKALALIGLARGTARTSTIFNYSNNLPREPYTPRVIDFNISYKGAAHSPARFFHLHPFGFSEPSAGDSALFPAVPAAGELYIGLSELQPLQKLALLFQVLPGTANPLKSPPSLAWNYLRGDEWVELSAQAVDDKTYNLSGSGILGIAVPPDANTHHSRLTTGLHWLRLSVAADADALNDLLLVAAQATSVMRAVASDPPVEGQFLPQPLPAGTISRLKIGDPAIKKVSQPFDSFGGRQAESPKLFYLRASEHLRHKDRAAAIWDYERLVLENFPQIYKVKCINHTRLLRDSNNNIIADDEQSPGDVLLVTIPDLRGAQLIDPLLPYTDRQTLQAIGRFLRRRISPFVRLEVTNPKFEQVQVEFTVAFNQGIADIAFYKQALETAIIHYLSPWAYAEGAEISFGGRWHKSSLINFIEEQPYVDYLLDLKLYHKPDIGQTLAEWKQKRVDEQVVEATATRSILVSYPRHIITEIGSA